MVVACVALILGACSVAPTDGRAVGASSAGRSASALNSTPGAAAATSATAEAAVTATIFHTTFTPPVQGCSELQAAVSGSTLFGDVNWTPVALSGSMSCLGGPLDDSPRSVRLILYTGEQMTPQRWAEVYPPEYLQMQEQSGWSFVRIAAGMPGQELFPPALTFVILADNHYLECEVNDRSLQGQDAATQLRALEAVYEPTLEVCNKVIDLLPNEYDR